MKHRIIVASIFAVLCSTGLIAQNISDLPSNSFPFNFGNQTMMRFDNRHEGVQGTPTFFDDFRFGTVELTKGKYNNVLINYDAYSDNLIAKSEKIKDPVQVRKDMVLNFVLKDMVGGEFVFTKHTISGTPTFLLNLVRDTISLYCRVAKPIKKVDLSGAYNVSEKRYDEFVTVNTYYAEKGNGGLQEIQKTRKGVLQAFPEYNDQLSAYLKKNKVDFNNYDEMKLLVTYINSL